MGGVDLSVFQFDPFLSWGRVLHERGQDDLRPPSERLRPGPGATPVDSNPNHTVAGLKAALRRALVVHAAYPEGSGQAMARIAGGARPGPEPRMADHRRSIARRQLKYGRLATNHRCTDQRGCAHCHEIQRAAASIRTLLTGKKRDRDDMLWVYPHPVRFWAWP